MTRRVHELDEAFHFGKLTGDRIVMEAMTNFAAGAPLDDVLQYIHKRLTLLENGDHNIGSFSINAWTLIPSFTIDAVVFENIQASLTVDSRVYITPVEPSPFTLDAMLMPQFSINAVILRAGPDEILHQDFFTNQWLNSWGTPDTGIGWPYGYTNDAHEDASDKFEYTQDVTDPDYPDNRGQYIEQDQTYYHHTLPDEGVYNKRERWLVTLSRGDAQEAQGIRFEYNGSDGFVRMFRAADGTLGPDRFQLYVDGVMRVESYDDSGGVFNTWRMPSKVYIEVEANGAHHRARWWAAGGASPSWNTAVTSRVENVHAIKYSASVPVGGESTSGIQWDGHGGGIIVYDSNGAPWTHYIEEWTIESFGVGVLHANAFVQPYFTMDALLTRGGVWRLDAFVLPTFRIDAELVLTTVDSFTLDAVIPLLVNGSLTLDAVVKPYFTMDAWIFAVTTASFSLDATKVFTFGDNLLLDAVVKREISASFTANSMLAVTESRTFKLDAWKANGGDFGLDAYIGPGGQVPLAAVVKAEQLPTFPVDSRIVDPELLREFFIYAYIPPPDGSFTIDAILKKVNDHIVHWDDFDNRVTTGSLGTPSHRGRYTYSANPQFHTVSGGVWNHSDWPNADDVVYLAGASGSVDREVYWELDYEPNSGITIGNYYLQIAGNLRFRIYAANNAAWVIQYAGVDTGYSLTPGTNGFIGMRANIYNKGKNLKWKLWVRSSGEPELWEQWIDMGAAGWNITDAVPYWNALSSSWFGQGNPPFDHDHDNVLVTMPSNVPFLYQSDAVFLKSNTDVFTIDALKEVVPFTIDAFILPTFRIDARIWLGTTFSMDAIIEAPFLFQSGKITHVHESHDSASSWTPALTANSKALIVYGYDTPPSAVTFGNKAVPSRGSSVWALDDFSGRDDNVIRITGAGTFQGSVVLSSLEDISYVTLASTYPTTTQNDTIAGPAGRATFHWMSGGHSDPWTGLAPWLDETPWGQGYLLSRKYNTNPVIGWARATSIGLDGPDTTSHKSGVIDTGSGLSAGTGYLFQSPTTSFDINAFINKIFTIQAHIVKNIVATPFPMAAWKHENFEFSFTIDAALFDFGEQLRDFSLSAWLEPQQEAVRPTQFGWLEPGWVMWADVFVERALRRFNVNALINAFDITSPLIINAVISSDESSTLGEFTLGEGTLGG